MFAVFGDMVDHCTRRSVHTSLWQLTGSNYVVAVTHKTGIISYTQSKIFSLNFTGHLHCPALHLIFVRVAVALQSPAHSMTTFKDQQGFITFLATNLATNTTRGG